MTQIACEARLSDRLARIEGLALLEPGWDSYGSERIAPTAIDTARGLLQCIDERYGKSHRAHALPWGISPVADGSIQLTWKSAERVLDVDIAPTGSMGYLCVDGADGQQRFAEADGVALATILDLIGTTTSG